MGASLFRGPQNGWFSFCFPFKPTPQRYHQNQLEPPHISRLPPWFSNQRCSAALIGQPASGEKSTGGCALLVPGHGQGAVRPPGFQPGLTPQMNMGYPQKTPLGIGCLRLDLNPSYFNQSQTTPLGGKLIFSEVFLKTRMGLAGPRPMKLGPMSEFRLDSYRGP